MNFRQFEAFYWIGRLGSFHAAARHLKTSQPAISARIREMELELGVMLLDRSDRKVRLTSKGEELLPYAAQLIELASEIKKRVGAREALEGRVRIGVTSISAMTWGRELLKTMALNYPGINVELMVETSELLSAQIEAGQLEVAVLAGPIDSAKVVAEALGNVPMAFIASPKLNFPRGPLSASQLAQHAIISDRPGTHLHAAAMAWFRGEGVTPERNHACSSLPTRIQLAVQGVGIAFAAPSAANDEFALGTLRLVSTVRPVPALQYYIAYPDLGLSPAARIVAETAKLLIGQKPDFDSYYSAVEHFSKVDEA
jgi:DNA-binding transcriptional LysR family regulator